MNETEYRKEIQENFDNILQTKDTDKLKEIMSKYGFDEDVPEVKQIIENIEKSI